MSGTYVAWNGESYPWPPPEGWYEGSDGRWWAPGSGPEPDRSIAAAERTAEPEAATTDPGDTGHSPAEAGPGRDGSADPDETDQQDPTSSEQQTVITKPTRPLPGHAETLAAAAGVPTSERTHADADQPGGDPGHNAQTATVGDGPTEPSGVAAEQRSTRSTTVLVLVAGAATLLLIGAGLVALLNRGADEETTASAPSTTTAAEAPADQATAAETDTAETDTPDGSTAPLPTTPVEGATTSTAPQTTAPTAVDAEDTARAAAWRDALADRGIDTTALTDEDIIDFGKSFCVFAVVSVDAEEFDTYRDRAQTGVAGALSEAQLTAAIDTAVATFCPEDAERLGIVL